MLLIFKMEGVISLTNSCGENCNIIKIFINKNSIKQQLLDYIWPICLYIVSLLQ